MSSSCSFPDNYTKDIQTQREAKDSAFLVENESPLSGKQIDSFTGLNYFPVNNEFAFDARLETFSEEQIIELKTSTDRLSEYKLYGFVFFDYMGKEHKLTAYQSVKHQEDSLYDDLLFLPFTDDNSTVTTYGGGRYVDVKIPDGLHFILDFNKAYNPYCAYNHKWSCVIPPRENALDIAIDAGEKNYLINH